MFSSLTRRLGGALLEWLDRLVELSTLGEYGVDSEGFFALEGEGTVPAGSHGLGAGTDLSVPPGPARPRDVCPYRSRFSRPRREALSRSCRDASARP